MNFRILKWQLEIVITVLRTSEDADSVFIYYPLLSISAPFCANLKLLGERKEVAVRI